MILAGTHVAHPVVLVITAGLVLAGVGAAVSLYEHWRRR
jgi:hypothetical protein